MENQNNCSKKMCGMTSSCKQPMSDEKVDAIAAVILLACVVTGIIYWLNSFSY